MKYGKRNMANCSFLVTFGVILADASKRSNDRRIIMVILGFSIVDFEPRNHTKCHKTELEIAIFHLAILSLMLSAADL